VGGMGIFVIVFLGYAIFIDLPSLFMFRVCGRPSGTILEGQALLAELLFFSATV
jgi:hypothetical protein